MQGALCCYTKALELTDSQPDSAVLYRNRSACYLKLEEYSNAEADASKGPTISIILLYFILFFSITCCFKCLLFADILGFQLVYKALIQPAKIH